MSRFLRFTLGSLLLAGVSFSQTQPPGPSPEASKRKAEAYYHFALGHLYADLARTYRSDEDFEKAVSNYRRAMEADPDATFMVEELVELFLQVNRWKDAVQEAEEALKANPDNLRARRILGQIYTRLLGNARDSRQQEGVIRLALEQYRAITEKEPQDADAWVRLGWLYRLSTNSLEAENAFKKALDLEPENEEALGELAKLYADLKETARAIETLERVKNPEFQTLLFLASLYEEQRNFDKAAAIYDRAASEAPDNPQVQFALAQSLIMAGQVARARQVYERLLQEQPENVQLLVRVAQLLTEERKYDEARKVIDRAKQLEPDNAEVRFHEVTLLEAEDKIDEAIGTLARLLDGSERESYSESQRSNRAMLLERLALLYQESNDTDRAVETFRRIEKLEASLAPRVAARVIGAYRGGKRFDRAVQEADRAIAAHPDDRMLRSVRASLLADVGRGDEGAEELKKMLGAGNDREVYLSLAQVYERSKNYDELSKVLQQAWDLSQTDEERENIHFLRGVMYEKTKEYDKSEAEFAKVLEINPENSSALNYLGYTLADRNVRIEQAYEYIKKALDLDPNNGAYLDSLGWVYYRMNRLEEAERHLRRALAKTAGDPVVNDHLGDVYFSQGRIKDAIAQWEASLKEWSTSAKAEHDPAEVAKVQMKLEKAKVRLAQEPNNRPKP